MTHRKALSLLLALFLILGLAPHAPAESAPALAAGDTLHGFEVVSTGTFDILGAPTVLLTHAQTGATVFYIATSDPNRAFDITFKTPALDNTGAPHVFEHATLAGSEKYPSANLFYALTNQTYRTFMNAMTGGVFTTYPLGSLSEEQLLALADVYLSGVFHPLLLTEERIYRREAWRYELESPDADITLTGTVLSEMQGASTIDDAAVFDFYATLYPGSIIGNNPGGDPDHITDLTYQQLLDFHEAYYHPSNCLVVLYGDLDINPFLELLDRDYFSHYDARDIQVPTGDIPPLTAPVSGEYAFPVEQTAVVDGASVLNYGFAANGADRDQALTLMLLASILGHEASALTTALRAALPGLSLSVYADTSSPQPTILFTATGADPSDLPLFQQVIDDTLAQLASDGFDRDIVDAVLAANRFNVLLTGEAANVGPSLAVELSASWAVYGDTEFYNNYLRILNQLSEDMDLSVYQDLTRTYLLDNPHRATSITYPQAGLAEEKAQVQADQLAALKASLTPEEVQALVDATADQAAFATQEPPQEMIDAVQVVTVDTLPEEIERYDVLDEDMDGVRLLTSPIQAGPIGYASLQLDTSGVAPDDLHYLNLYASLLGSLPTSAHTLEEIATLNTRYLNGMSVSAGMQERPGKTYTPALAASWMTLTEDTPDALALAREILFETDFSDTQTLASLISTQRVLKRESIRNAPYLVQMQRVMAAFKDYAAYDSYLTGLDYYLALGEIEALMATDPDQVAARLTAIRDQLTNTMGATVLFVGNEETAALFTDSLPVLLGGLPSEPIQAADLSTLPVPALREALVLDTTVQFNMIYAPLEDLGLADSGVLAPLDNMVYDLFLLPRLRHGHGAYDAITSMNREGILLGSYRDPEITKTYDAYDVLPAFLRNLDLDQEALDNYIINAYSSYATPTGAINGGSRALTLHLAGRSQEEKLARMGEMKAFTVADVQAFASAFAILSEEGARSTAGGGVAVEAHSDLFDEILTVD